MKTIQQALLDEVYYPIPVGFVENVAVKRGLDLQVEFDSSIATSPNYSGALADCLVSLVQSISFSEADKSISALSDKDKERILLRANSIYSSIGEATVEIAAKPMVYVGDCLL